MKDQSNVYIHLFALWLLSFKVNDLEYFKLSIVCKIIAVTLGQPTLNRYVNPDRDARLYICKSIIKILKLQSVS